MSGRRAINLIGVEGVSTDIGEEESVELLAGLGLGSIDPH